MQTRPADCTPQQARAQRPIEVSGDHVFELQGRDSAGDRCRGWARISLRAFAPVLVTTQAVRSGDPLDGAARLEERELLPGRDRLVSLAPGATAARTLPAGTELAPRLVRDPGPRPGDPVQVVFRGRGLAIERPGRVVACGGNLACAIVASGKKVVGRRVGDRIEVDAR
ncbi:MAG TPA: hypothetical protein VN033_02495 [Vulgatibacter sp.]|nr:hypothetical protein [Vulgatibacter sp.]